MPLDYGLPISVSLNQHIENSVSHLDSLGLKWKINPGVCSSVYIRIGSRTPEVPKCKGAQIPIYNAAVFVYNLHMSFLITLNHL
jgi:threonine/homoserine efflux transporter RhtA